MPYWMKHVVLAIVVVLGGALTALTLVRVSQFSAHDYQDRNTVSLALLCVSVGT